MRKKLNNLLIYRFKDANDIISAFNVDPIFLKHQHQGSAPDYRVMFFSKNELDEH